MPYFFDEAITAIVNLPNEVKGVIAAVFISIIRVISDQEETRPVRILLEGLICGALSYTANAGISAMGWESDWSIFIGGTIGYIGSASVRMIALQYLNKKTK